MLTYRELIEACIQNSKAHRAMVSVESLTNYLQEGIKEIEEGGGLPLLDAILESSNGDEEI
jgi:hypothetical protein